MSENEEYIRIMKIYQKPLNPVKTFFKKKGSLKYKIKAVLFDIYGTLFISSSGDITVAKEKVKLKKLKRLLKKYNINIDAEEVLNKYLSGIESSHDFLKKKGIDFPEVQVDEIWMSILKIEEMKLAKRFAVEYESIFNPVWTMPYLKELLEACRSMKLLMGLISNAQFFSPLLFNVFYNHTIEELGFSTELIFLSYRYSYAKPSLFLFEKARDTLVKIGVDAKNALYVGNDKLNDIYPAKKVGFQTALFAGDKRSLNLRESSEDVKKISSDIIVTNLKELSEYIKVGVEL